MISLLINGIQVDTPDDFSVDMRFDNPYFKKSEDYSLDIELALDCPNNHLLFGNVGRLDVSKQKLSFPAVMQVNASTVFKGKATIIKITNRFVKLQLLGGTSEVNYFASDKMIDELPLAPLYMGVPYTYTPDAWLVHDDEHKTVFGSVDDADMVMFDQYTIEDKLPKHSVGWCDYLVGSEIYIERAFYIPVQPYLLKMIERVFTAAGYQIGRNDIADSWMRNLYIVNHRRKPGWTYRKENNQFKAESAIALPHWSFTTFLDELEKFLCVIFIINDNTVDIIDLNRFYEGSTEIVYIPEDCVLEEYEVELNDTGNEKNVTYGNVGYGFDYTDKFLKPDASVMAYSDKTEYEDYKALSEAFNAMDSDTRKTLVWVDKSTGREYIEYTADGKTSIKPVNVFGNLMRNHSDKVDVTLNIVPADTVKRNVPVYFDDTTIGGAVHLGFPLNQIVTKGINIEEASSDSIQSLIENNETVESTSSEDKSVMEVALSTGDSYVVGQVQGHDQKYPISFVDFKHDGGYKLPEMSLSLHDVCENSIGHRLAQLKNLDSGQPYIIRFLADKKPNVRAIFVVRNKRFVCNTISVTYENVGDKFVYEGEFFLYE